MPPRGVKKGTKRARQYEHIKESAKEGGASEDRAEEIAARTVNKERARHGESKTSSKLSRTDISSGRRGGLRSHGTRGRGRTLEQLYRGGPPDEDRRPLEDEQGAAAARGRRAQALIKQRRGPRPAAADQHTTCQSSPTRSIADATSPFGQRRSSRGSGASGSSACSLSSAPRCGTSSGSGRRPPSRTRLWPSSRSAPPQRSAPG